ncbi:MAG: c-type cytochrome, methanol metabolism-related [Candidatus Saccharibacteria bacterium]|nr:c-type cytochrome, methanol metabolism-related [Pseudorhodobacter sp.]
MTKTSLALSLSTTALLLMLVAPTGAQDTTVAASAANITADHSEDGRYLTADGIPTFNITADGKMDWPTYSGYRRYHSECHVCHGPDGEGSSYAPALKNSALTLDYYDFIAVVANGRQVVNAAQSNVMPAFGSNPNVMCYLDDIYTYLKARGAGAVPRGRPAAKEAKSDEFAAAEKSCMGN